MPITSARRAIDHAFGKVSRAQPVANPPNAPPMWADMSTLGSDSPIITLAPKKNSMPRSAAWAAPGSSLRRCRSKKPVNAPYRPNTAPDAPTDGPTLRIALASAPSSAATV